jgi:hypothetical protein
MGVPTGELVEMLEDVHVRFESGRVDGALGKVQSALRELGVQLDVDPKEFPDCVRALIFKGSWERVSKAAIREALIRQGLPGAFTIEAESFHGFVG